MKEDRPGAARDTMKGLLGIELPLVQAPIGSASCPELAAEVSNAGGLGMLALSWRSLDEVRAVIVRTRELTSKPFGVNVVLAWPQIDRLIISLEEGVGAVSTFWGDPSPFVDLIHEGGAIHIHSVGSVGEAIRAADCGVDLIVAQGLEAGGHVRGTTPLRELLTDILEAVRPTPVVAAGGIATGTEAAELIDLGAAGVWVGTRFVCSLEANVHPAYQEAILAAGPGDTYHGEVFTKGWDDAAHRVLRNATVESWLVAGEPRPGRRPGEKDIVAYTYEGNPIERYSDIIPLPGMTGDVRSMALYAGKGAARISSVVPASEIVAEFREALLPGRVGDR